MQTVDIKTDRFHLSGIKLVIFDKDGTIFDLHKYWSFVIKERANYFSKLPLNSNINKVSENLKESMGLLKSDMLNKNGPVGVESRSYIVGLVCEVLGKFNYTINEHEVENGFKLIDKLIDKNLDKTIYKLPGVDRILDSLNNKMCYVTLATSDISSRAISTLTYANIIGKFDYIVASDQVCNPKPHKEIILKIISNFDSILPNEVVLIGDSMTDIDTAKNSGINFIGVNTGSSSVEFIERSNLLVDNLLDLEVELTPHT